MIFRTEKIGKKDSKNKKIEDSQIPDSAEMRTKAQGKKITLVKYAAD